MIDFCNKLLTTFLNNSARYIKFKLCTAVIYYINVICLKQFHEKAIHNKI